MTIYMLERDLPGISMGQLAAAQKAAIATAAQMNRGGEAIRYIRSTFVPATGRCMCLFDGSSSDCVKKLNDTAAIPYTAVTEALDLSPP